MLALAIIIENTYWWWTPIDNCWMNNRHEILTARTMYEYINSIQYPEDQ